MKLVCVVGMLGTSWAEVKSVTVPHGTVSPIDDVVRLVVIRVWMSLLGDEVSDMSVT